MLLKRRLSKRVAEEVITEAILNTRSMAYINGLLHMAYELGVISKSEFNKLYLEALDKTGGK